MKLGGSGAWTDRPRGLGLRFQFVVNGPGGVEVKAFKGPKEDYRIAAQPIPNIKEKEMSKNVELVLPFEVSEGTVTFMVANDCFAGAMHNTKGPGYAKFENTSNGWVEIERRYYIDGKPLTEEEHAQKTAPAKELTLEEVEKLLGCKVKIVRGAE